MGYTYRFSVEVGHCCAQNLQSSLEVIFPKSTHTIRVSSIKKCVQFETLDDDKYSFPRYLGFIRSLKKKGYDCQEPWVPHWIQGLVGIVLGTAVLLACVFAPYLPIAAMIAMGVVSFISTFLLGFHSFKRAWKTMKNGNPLTMDFLFLISTLASLAVSIAAIFVPWLPMMFEVGLLIFGFRHLGLALESSMLKKIDKEVNFKALAPKKVLVKTNEGTEKTCDITAVKKGEIILIQPGEVVGLDGEVLTEQVKVSEKNLTGQNGVRTLTPGKVELAGIQLEPNSPVLALKVIRTEEESYLAKMDTVTQQAFTNQAPIEEKTAKALMYFVPVVILIAIISGLLVGLFVGLGLGISCAIAVLLSACPCALGLVVPLAMKIGVEKAGRHGLILARGEALERAKNIDTVVFDLNGTLTAGSPSVQDQQWYIEDEEKSRVIALIGAIESRVLELKKEKNPPIQVSSMSTVIAQALIQAFSPAPDLKDQFVFETTGAGGISVVFQNQRWRIGNSTFMCDQGLNLPVLEHPLQPGTQALWIAADQTILGRVILHDALRPEAEETILMLKKLKKDIYICTGADEESAKRYGEQLQIPPDHIFADCLPIHTEEEQTQTSLNHASKERYSKFHWIKTLQMQGHQVAMVGDGVNDAPVMPQSQLGIAMLHAETDPRTKQNTQVHLAGSSLKPLQYLFPIATQTHVWIKICLGLSLSYNVISILLSSGLLLLAGVALNPALGAVLMVVQLALLLLGAFIVHRSQVKLPGGEPLVVNSYTQMTEQGLEATLDVRPNVEPLHSLVACNLEKEPVELPGASNQVTGMSM